MVFKVTSLLYREEFRVELLLFSLEGEFKLGILFLYCLEVLVSS